MSSVTPRPPSRRKRPSAAGTADGGAKARPTKRQAQRSKKKTQGKVADAPRPSGEARTKPAPSARRAPTPAPTEPSRWLRWRERLLALTRVPAFVYLGGGFLALLLLLPAANWLYQVARKPTELFFPVSEDYYKTPSETWRAYGAAFRAHSTAIMTPELLAALAQKEASGNPVARTYWRWRESANPFEIYRPASSAVGMYQFTDGTFDEARRYCIHHHRVVADGPWHDFESCWFNRFYARVIPTHAIELAAADLDRKVRQILARQRLRGASLRRQQELAILTHLCGAGAAARFAARGLATGAKCGDHDPRRYVLRVLALAETFARLRAAEARD